MASKEFIKSYIGTKECDSDIFAMVQRQTFFTPIEALNIMASNRDFMLILGQFCIEKFTDIKEAKTYLGQPISASRIFVSYFINCLITQYKQAKINGPMELILPVCATNDQTNLNHWTLLSITIDNGLVIQLKNHDPVGKRSIKVIDNFSPIAKLTGQDWYGWFSDCPAELFSKACTASTVLYDTQNPELQVDATCLDRIIVIALDLIGCSKFPSLNISQGGQAYAGGLDGAIALRSNIVNIIRNQVEEIMPQAEPKTRRLAIG